MFQMISVDYMADCCVTHVGFQVETFNRSSSIETFDSNDYLGTLKIVSEFSKNLRVKFGDSKLEFPTKSNLSNL